MARKDTSHKAELRICSWRGHETFEPTDDDAIREQLVAKTAQGEAWRCLRCGTYVLGQPKQSGPLADAPKPLRGKELQQAIIMRLLAIERIGRASLLLLAGYAIIRFRSAHNSLQTLFAHELPILKQIGVQLNIDVESSSLVHLTNKVLSLSEKTLLLAAIAVFVYATIQIIEGTGLWLLKRWGEWFAVVATTLFTPLEIWEVIDHTSVTKIGALVVNLLAVVYLVYTKKLWPGGAAIYEKMHASESIIPESNRS